MYPDIISTGRRLQIKRALARSWRQLTNVSSARGEHHTVVCPILCYHSVNDEYDSHADPLACRLFGDHVKYLAKHCNVVPLSDVVRALDDGGNLPPRSVAISFDDGYIDNYENAYPILRDHGTPATFFVVSGFVDGEVDLIGNPRWCAMTWQQIAEIGHDEQMAIGAHGVTHRKLSSLSAAETAREMAESRVRIERQAGVKARLFAYPDGQGTDISVVAKTLAADLGFAGACSTFWRTTHRVSDRFMLSRVMISSRDSVADLEMKVAGAYDFLYYVHKAKALGSVLTGQGGVWR